MKRYWINSPSKDQADNIFHGMLVLGPEKSNADNDIVVRVWTIESTLISMNVYESSLSPGWPDKLYTEFLFNSLRQKVI